jgi:2'-5' RNA ligase
MAMSGVIRAFIAINIPEKLKDKLAEVQNHLKRLPGEFSWVRKEGFHLTLKFLGNILPSQIVPISDYLRKASQGISPFPLKFVGLGAFPQITRPRVIWIGLEDPIGNLKKLQYNLEWRLEQLGFEREGREFSPHLTLGRVKSLKNKAPLLKLITEYKVQEDWIFQVEKVSLMQSDLKPTGAVYSVLEEVRLEIITS